MTITGNTDNTNWKLVLEAYERSYSIENNTSEVRVDMYLKRVNSNGYLGGNWSASITVDGTSQNLSGNIPYPTYVNKDNTLYLSTKDYTVEHNTDGTKTASVSASFSSSDFTPHSGTASGNLVLSNIPRYASISQSLSSKTETSITMNWSSDSTIDRVWYSTNNGSSWSSAITVNAKSGSYTITGLTANTSYNIKTRVRRADSQLTSDSSVLNVATYDYPYITNVETQNLIIGNSQKITLYNPLSRSVTIKMYQNNTSGTQLYSGTTSGTTITFTPSANTLYSSIPSAQSSTCVYTATYGSSTRTKSNSYTYKIIGTETPTFNDFTYADTNSTTINITGNNQILIKNKSQLRVTVSSANKMVAINSATGSKYNITCGNRSSSLDYSTSDVYSDLGTISSSGSISCTVKAIDSRSLSKSVSKNITVIDYFNPTIIPNISRVNNFENTTNISCSGTFARLYINGTVKNTISLARFRYKKINDSTYSSWTNFDITLNNNNGTYTCANKTVLLDNTDNYSVQLEITDIFGSYTETVIVSEGIPIMFLSSTYKNVGIGVQNDHEEYSLEVAGNLYVDKTVKDMFSVEDLRGKNLFNIHGQINILDNSDDIAVRNTVSNNILTTTTNSWAQHSTGQKITGVANKTITVSADVVSTGTGQYGVIYVNNNSGTTIASQRLTANNKILITCTPTTDIIKICFATTGDTQSASGRGAQFANIQVELGNEKTEYKQYKEYSNQEIYSTDETVVGTWIDGKTLYRKTFTGTLTNGGTKSFDSGLTNENICRIYGVAREESTGYTLPIPHVNISSVSSGIRIDYIKSTHKLNISNGGNLSGYTAYVTIEYTKN